MSSNQNRRGNPRAVALIACCVLAIGMKLAVGQRLAFVFSRASSLAIEGEKESARRISGTSRYTVSDVGLKEATLTTVYRLDGSSVYTDPTRLRLDGTRYCNGDTCQDNTDGSSILYNRLIFGTPPATLRAGTRWASRIGQPWELGPPGTQTVTVVRVSDAGHEVTLRREGSGVGESIDGKRTLTLKRDGKDVTAEVQTVRTTWTGYSVYRDGVLQSDELLATSDVVVAAGVESIPGKARQYILMNAAPADSPG